MKKMILLAALATPALLFAQEGNFTLNGKISGLNSAEKAYFGYRVDDKTVEDSVEIKNGAFVFSGELKNPTLASLYISHNGVATDENNRPIDQMTLYIEPGNIQVTTKDSIKLATVSGSQAHLDFLAYKEASAPFDERMEALNKEFMAASDEQKKDEAFRNTFMERADVIMKEQAVAIKSFIDSHPNAYISLSAVNNYAYMTEADGDQLEKVFNTLSAGVKTTEAGQAIAKRIVAMKSTQIGATAPLFTQNDPDGKPISLTDFRGKYLLIDFWASWCGPCRKENPNVVAAYNQFKDKNFEILGVSLDNERGRDAWLKAIEKDGLTWPQVSDLKYWKNEVAQLYAVQSIPQNFLLDPEGKIIAKNLRGDELAAKLAEILK